MTANPSFLHPAVFFFGGLALTLALPKSLFRYVLLLPAVAAVAAVLYMSGNGVTGTYATFSYLGLKLTFGRVDQLTIVFAHVFAIQSVLGFLFAFHVKEKPQHLSALLYVGGAFGCLFAGDYLTLFIFWELMSIGSTFLIWLNNNPKSTSAGFRYFLFHILGGLFLLCGLLLKYGASKELGISDPFAFGPINPATAHYYDYLILLGFCVNAAVVPLHAWLPDAYPEATVTGAVFMSAFTTKTAVYVLARSFAGFEVLAIAGTVMCLYGVFYATIENNARRILSYHIVSQVGYMVAGIGIGTAMTVNGACAHAYAHILYKGLLFMGAGTLLYATGTAKLSELGGLVKKLPLVFIFYMVAAVSISGMPFFNGFVSKTMTITGAAEAHRTWLALGMEIAAVGTFLSVGLKLPYFAFFAKPTSTLEVKPIPWNMYAAMAIGSALCIFTGNYSPFLYDLLPFQASIAPYTQYVKELAHTAYVPYTQWHVLQAFLILGFTGLGFYTMRKVIVPHAKLNLDFEFFYRLFGRGFLFLFSKPIAWIDSLWSEVYEVIGLRLVMLGLASGASIFDKKGIDGVLDNSVYGVGRFGGAVAKLQTGNLQNYVAGSLIVGLGAFALFWYLT